MIPKIIHYCWFGNKPLPALAIKCIDSWRKFLPDYEIKEWNEENFDINIIRYTKEAYEAKKYAFVSDYARYWILYHHGGLYFDTDVEIIKPLNDIINRGSFMGCENYDITGKCFSQKLGINPGLGMGSTPRHPFFLEMLNLYSTEYFINDNGTLNLKNIVNRTTEAIEKYGLVFVNEKQNIANIWIYPKEYFNPRNLSGKLVLTPNTCSIHHFAASWLSPKVKLKEHLKIVLAKIIGENVYKYLRKIKRMINFS